jgi:hypothetical protein
LATTGADRRGGGGAGLGSERHVGRPLQHTG